MYGLVLHEVNMKVVPLTSVQQRGRLPCDSAMLIWAVPHLWKIHCGDPRHGRDHLACLR